MLVVLRRPEPVGIAVGGRFWRSSKLLLLLAWARGSTAVARVGGAGCVVFCLDGVFESELDLWREEELGG